MVGCELSCGYLVRVAFRTICHIPYTGRAREVLRVEMVGRLVVEVDAA